MADAEKIIDVRSAFANGSLVVIRVWRVAQPVPPSRHAFKYSFFYGRPGMRVVLFDNERGKGDHVHIRGIETPYDFIDIETLEADFRAAVRAAQATETP